MKRLLYLSLLFISLCILSSCSSQDQSRYLLLADESADFETRLSIYRDAVESNPDDYRAYYNLAYLYLYGEDYQDAEQVLLASIDKFRDSFRFYSALLYLYENTKEKGKELDLLLRMMELTPADEQVRTRLLELLDESGDPRAYDEARDTLLYFPDNQIAINILAKRHPFFESRAVINSTEEDILALDLPLSYYASSPLVNQDNYKETFLSSNGGTVIENGQSQSE